MKKIVLIILIMAGITSCEKETKKLEDENKTQTVEVEPKKDDILKVVLEVSTEEADRIQLFYTSESEEEGYSAKKQLIKSIKGASESEKIEFELPAKIIPYKLRIDLGDNSNRYESQINILSVTFKLNDNEFFITPELMDSFFQPNIYLERNANGYKRKIVEEKYDPFIVSKAILIKKIELDL